MKQKVVFVHFNMETGLVDNYLCVGRKGRMECHVTVDGVEVHAGNDFSSRQDRNERKMALKVIEIQKLTDLESGITVSVGKINGGSGQYPMQHLHNAL